HPADALEGRRRVRRANVNVLQLAAEEPQIAAGVDSTAGDIGVLQYFYGAIDSEPFGDAVERIAAGRAIKKAVGGRPYFLCPVEHAARPGIEARPAARAQPGDVARALLRAHGMVDAFDGNEGALDGAQRPLAARGRADLDQRTEERPGAPNVGAARVHGGRGAASRPR